MLCGGTGSANPADETIQQIVDQLRNDIHVKSGKQFPHLKAVSYKTQVVAGTNYFIKVDAGSEHIHLRVFKPLPFNGDQPELHGVQLGKTLQDELSHF